MNFFNILATADKELVHSAMLKFFLESDPIRDDFIKNFIGISNLQSKGEVNLEQSDKNHKTGERIRFDLLMTASKDDKTPILAVENKFKATPTLRQLKTYDDYFELKNIQNVHKVLFVFSECQLPISVSEYCQNRWKVLSYFSLIEDDGIGDNLLRWLERIKSNNRLDEKSKLLLNDYYDYLLSYKKKIRTIIENYNFVRYNLLSERFIYFQYLLYIQGLISEQFSKYQLQDIDASNDEGKNVIPGIAFWMDVENKNNIGIKSVFSAIDGSTFKFGIFYKMKEDETINGFIDRSFQHTKELKTIALKRNNRNLKSLDNNKQWSVYSIFTGKILENQPREDVVAEIAEISAEYFKKFI
jgi:hypothetical protein